LVSQGGDTKKEIEIAPGEGFEELQPRQKLISGTEEIKPVRRSK
jgi:hypothetical protein